MSISHNPDEFIWEQKYRPHKVSECILPIKIKETFQNFVNVRNIPNLLLVGLPGVGKTTSAETMLDEIGCDYMKVPASLKGNIDTLRTEITDFASSVSFKGGRKYILLDEADYLTHVTQPALRNFMDEYSENCGFILTANYGNKIIDAISKSRCVPIEFTIPKEEAPILAKQFLKRVEEILALEKVEYSVNAVAAVISKYYPNWRRILGELQRYSLHSSIDMGVVTSGKEASSIKELIKFLKEKNFTKIRQWAAENSASTDHAILTREFYDVAYEYFKPQYIPQLVLTISKYNVQSAVVFDQEINFVAFCVEIMIEGEWR